MYTLSSWRSHSSVVAVELLHQKEASTVGSQFKAYVPGEVTRESRMTNVHSKYLEKSSGYRGNRSSAPGTR